MRFLALVVLLVAAVLFTGCGRKKKKVRTPPVPATVGSIEVGLASWYGHPYHGRASASGEIYDMEQMTAAHRTLPFGTIVRVLNLDNHKAVEVRINDRGPFFDGRVIDLSHAAAKSIEMIGPGTARVRVEVIAAPAAIPGRYAVQVGAFREHANAERIRSQMQRQYGVARIVQRPGASGMWRVLVGSEPNLTAAGELAQHIRGDGGERAVFVVRLDNDGF